MPIETQRDDGPSAVSVSTKVVVVQALRPIDDDRREVESKLFRATRVDLIFRRRSASGFERVLAGDMLHSDISLRSL